MEGTSVEAGKARSTVLVMLSSFFSVCFDTCGSGHHRLQSLLQPRPQCLSQQSNRGHEEQHHTATSGFVLGDSQRSEGFTRTAGHDELAARMCRSAGSLINLEIGVGLVDGSMLMRLYVERLRSRCNTEEPLFEFLPIYLIALKVDEIEPRYRRILVADSLLGRRVPFVGGRYPQSLNKSGHSRLGLEKFSGCGQERVDVRLVDEGFSIITFALDGPIFAVNGACNKVDADILAAELLVVREIVP